MKKNIKFMSVLAALLFTTGAYSQVLGGLFVEARGTFTFGNGNSDAIQTGDLNATPKQFETPGTKGLGGGLTLGYGLAENLGVVLGYDFRNINSRDLEMKHSATISSKTVGTSNTHVISLGLRPMVAAFGGNIYAGGGLAVILPYESKTVTTFTGHPTVTEQTYTTGRTSAFGVFGEVGFQYDIMPNVYSAIGARMVVATATNEGMKEMEETKLKSGTTISQANKEYGKDKDDGFNTVGITDFGVAVSFGYRL